MGHFHVRGTELPPFAKSQQQSPIRGRFAPSPSGDLHLGNLRTALLSWLAARRQAGAWLLRLEDLDQPRVRPHATAHLLDDLRWLGLEWDEGPGVGGPFGPYVQSQRLAIYRAYLARLHERGYLYPCFCSRAELARVASAPTPGASGQPYPGICRNLSAPERRARAATGRIPSWRFRVPEGIVRFMDGVAGPQSENVALTVGDFIICRSDGVIAYQFAVVVDDALMRISQVVRGADLLDSTARQITLYQALGWPVPEFTHVPLMLDASGAKLAKRDRSAGITALRRSGAQPEAVLGQLAFSAGIWPEGVSASLQELLAHASWPWDDQ